MKSQYFLLSLLLFLICTIGDAQNRIIQQPDFESSNSEFLEINKLELNDSATILYCDAYHRPNNWVLISSGSYLKGNTGHIYKLLHSEGFELDKQVFMPESGNISFKLFMQPLSSNENSFDFIVGDNEGAFKIMGIKTSESPNTNSSIHCKLKGEVINRPQSSRLVLMKEGGDERVSAIYIPIKNGKFEYMLNCNTVESYELVFFDEYFGSGRRPIKFFADSSLISFKLFPQDEFIRNQIEGGFLNKEYAKYQTNKESISQNNIMRKQIDSLENAGKYYSEAVMAVRQQREATDDNAKKDSLVAIMSKMYKSGEAYSPEMTVLNQKRDELNKKFIDWESNYIRENTSIMAYSLLVKRLQNSIEYLDGNFQHYKGIYDSIYAKKYPSHPYTVKLNNLINSYSSIKVGGSFIDFTAPDFAGNRVKLSEQIKGKVALLDLWASWCGPCRKRSMSMIPVYEAYKNKGFTIVGIAREKELSAGINAVKKDNYPWLNLIELKDAGRIWEKYGLGNSGGSTFLINKDGTILAISPSDEEIRKILDQLLP